MRTLLIPFLALTAASAVQAAAPITQDPPGCFEVLPALVVRVFRANGTTGVVGPVSPCETLTVSVELRKKHDDDAYCAFGGGALSLVTPDGVEHPVTADVPCLGGAYSPGCDPTVDLIASALIPYAVSADDRPASGTCFDDAECDASSECLAGICRGALRFEARYVGGASDLGGGPVPLGDRIAFGVAAAATCEDTNPCMVDGCDPGVPGPGACFSTPVACVGPGPCAPPCALDCSTCDPSSVPVCGNGVHEAGEACDLGRAGNGAAWSCCTPACTVRAAGETCRPAAGPCDVAEACSGEATCPPDLVAPATQVCRPGAGPCDVDDRCNGTDPACPPIDLKLAGTVCRDAADACDVAEQCDGQSAECPPIDRRAERGTRCGAGARGFCDGAGTCLETCGDGALDEGEECDGAMRPPDEWCTADCRLTACAWEEVGGGALVDLQTLVCSLAAPVDAGLCGGRAATLADRLNAIRERGRQSLVDAADATPARRVRALKRLRLRLTKLGEQLLGDTCANLQLGPPVLTWKRMIDALLARRR